MSAGNQIKSRSIVKVTANHTHLSRLYREGSSKVKYLEQTPQSAIQLDKEKLAGHSQIFQDLRKPKALHVIVSYRVGGIDVLQSRVSIVDAEIPVEALDGCRSSIKIFGITGDTPCIEV